MLLRTILLVAVTGGILWCQQRQPIGSVKLSNGHSVAVYETSSRDDLRYATDLSPLTGRSSLSELPKIALCKVTSIRFLTLEPPTASKLACDEVACAWRPAELRLVGGKVLSRAYLDVSKLALLDAQRNQYPLDRYRYTNVSMNACK